MTLKKVCVVLLLAILAAACQGDDGGGTQSTGFDEDSVLVVGTTDEPSDLDQFANLPVISTTTGSVTEAITDIDTDGRIYGHLAETVTQDPDDAKRWIVKLRGGITFHDGTPWDADALVANIERLLDPATESILPSELGTLTGAEKIDDMTVALVSSEPDPILDYRMRILNMVTPDTPHEPDSEPIGTGPYIFEEWVRGEHVLIRANPDYWGEPKPTIGQIEIRFIPDADTRMAALAAGEIDLNVAPVLSRLNEVDQILETDFAVSTNILRINPASPPMNDPNFRLALNYAINRDELNESLFGGLHTVNNCQLASSGVFGFNPDLQPYPYDPDKARELLAQVDIPDDFVVQLQTSTAVGYAQASELAQAVVGYWQAVGIDAETQLLELDPYLKLLRPTKEQSSIFYVESDHAFRNAARGMSLYVIGTGSTIPESHPVRALADEALRDRDSDSRSESMQEVLKTVCEEAYIINLLDSKQYGAANDNLEYEVGTNLIWDPAYNRMKLVE